jgi:glutamate racemase
LLIFLLSNGCKLILIACNSASANAFGELTEYVGDKALVLNVIDPVVDYIISEENPGHVGVIGTKATVNSNSYTEKIHEKNALIKVSSMATPLFVPMIEEGFIFDDISNAIIRSYLSKKEISDIQTLILGCTHYPIIRNQISRFYNFNVNVIDTARIVAEKLKETLQENDLLNDSIPGSHKFYVSDHTESFDVIARMFFGEKINLQKIRI